MTETESRLAQSETPQSKVLAFRTSKTTSTRKKVDKAIAAICNEGKGASIPAIVNWILNNYAIMDPRNVKTLVKRAILNGLDKGWLARSAGCSDCQGLQGSFCLPAAKGAPKKAKSFEKPSRDGDQWSAKRKGPTAANGVRKRGKKLNPQSGTDKEGQDTGLCPCTDKEVKELSSPANKDLI